MLRIIVIVLAAAACWKWGEWKRWREFYPTILYAIIGDIAYNFIFFDYPLWEYENFINHSFSDLFVAAVVFPSVIILFFTHWPAVRWKKPVYILVWSVGLTLLEYLSKALDFMSHSNGWNIFWSFGVYIGAFILIRLHYKHPLVVWPISGLLAVLTALIFRLPFEAIK